MVRGRDSLPVFHRMGMWLDRRWWLVAIYVGVMIGVLVLLRSG